MSITRMFLARKRLGLTQKEVADRIGVTQPRISAWENRTVEIPRARRPQLAEALGIDADELDLDA